MLVDERSAALQVPQAPSGTALARARAARWRCRSSRPAPLLAALTLLLPSAPTYDPWSWIIWGREIAHLDLVTTEGPSWKPLPVAFTTVFSLFGSLVAGPVARRRARRRDRGRRAWPSASRAARRRDRRRRRRGARAGDRAVVDPQRGAGQLRGPDRRVPAGAIDRHLAGDRRAAFLLAVCAGLLRPEAWPFLGLYGLFLLWRRALPGALVLGAGVAVLALWLLPEWWGSGDLLRAAHRAKNVNPGAPTYADNPAEAVAATTRARCSPPR